MKRQDKYRTDIKFHRSSGEKDSLMAGAKPIEKKDP